MLLNKKEVKKWSTNNHLNTFTKIEYQSTDIILILFLYIISNTQLVLSIIWSIKEVNQAPAIIDLACLWLHFHIV